MSTKSNARILIADDEPLYLKTTSQLLSKAGYECVGVPDGTKALELLRREQFDLVLSDLNMPGNLKFELLREGRSQWPTIPLIVVTGVPTMPSAIESVRLGIADYLLKPVKYEDLLSSIRRVLTTARRAPPQDSQPILSSRFPEIIGESPPMQELFEIMGRVATTDVNILVTGESGTGKEVVASAIHRHSLRAKNTFQIVDCTAIPETLFESVLFGHAKGAFTGAFKDQLGLLNQADGGTAFFDEIGELPLPLQAKLLRVIQEQTFTPIGKSAQQEIDTRFICATNRDLETEVNAGRFRRDLFYRLAVIHIELPPLRKRDVDISLLARHFLQRLQGVQPRVEDFTDETLELLQHYPWPGNIRELRNAVEHALAVSQHSKIIPADLPVAMRRQQVTTTASVQANLSSMSREDYLSDAEKSYLEELLKHNDGNISSAARQAEISRQALHKLLKKYGLDARDHR